MELGELKTALREGVWAMMMPVILLAGIYSGHVILLIEHRVPSMMVEFMQGYISSPWMFLLLVYALLLVVGCLMPPTRPS